jgi:ribose-phosphate pyrophosphokinase
MSERDDTLVLGFAEYREAAQRVAAAAGMRYAQVDIHTFPDGESRVRLPPALPDHVVLCRSLDHANSKLIELELAAATALALGARRLTLVAPYLCYMRQDAAFQPGESVSQRIIGELLARRFDTLVTVDPHLHRTHRLEEAVPVRRALALNAAQAMAAWVAAHRSDALLLGPDEESLQWVSAIAAPGSLDYGVGRKQRLGDHQVRVRLPELSFQDRHVVLVDDVASTGSTLADAARQLATRGPASISVLVSHALFVGNAVARLREAGVGTICSTDSIAHSSNQIRLDALLAEALTGEPAAATPPRER